MEEISFEELRKIHPEEKHSALLGTLAENYYDVYLDYLEKFYGGLKGDFSMEGAKTYENSKRVFLELVKLRCQKVVLKAFKDTAGGVSTDGLTFQEKELYLLLLKTFNRYENNLATFKPITTPVQEQSEVKFLKLEVLIDQLPAFVTPLGETLGPFSKGVTVELDEETAKLLVEKGACKEV